MGTKGEGGEDIANKVRVSTADGGLGTDMASSCGVGKYSMPTGVESLSLKLLEIIMSKIRANRPSRSIVLLSRLGRSGRANKGI